MTAVVASNQPLGAAEDLQQEKGVAGTSVRPCCSGARKTRSVYFSQATQGAGFSCEQKLPSAGRNGDTSRHLQRDQGRGTAEREALQAAGVISSAHHPCLVVDVWEAAAFGTHLSRR